MPRNVVRTHEVTKAFVMERACKVFKVPSVYDWQYEVCDAVLAGKDCVLTVPTGGGKTLSFYLPLLAYWQPGDNEPEHQKIVLIISPLVELMKEQVSVQTGYGRRNCLL